MNRDEVVGKIEGIKGWTVTATGGTYNIHWEMDIAFNDGDDEFDYSSSSSIELDFTYYFF